ncbi:MAG TPA: site-specific integrase [Polyangia bacterium]|nr:site-specific integrase [Polyangia bacterium]
MMVFRADGARTYKLRLSLSGHKPRTVSTGATDEATAADVEAMVKRFKGRRDVAGMAALVAVLDDDLSLAAVYDADMRGTLRDLVASLSDVDLEPLVSEWAKRANAKYVRQVRALIPEGERFPASTFTRKRVSVFLAELSCADPTRNRYRAALSVFAKWLVEREVIETNPVRDVAMYKEHDPRMVWMTWKDAQRVANASPAPLRNLFAIMASTGIELGAALRLTTADLDTTAKTIHARGSKTTWRNRVVRYEEWADVYVRFLDKGIGAVPLFPPMQHRDILAAFRDAQQAVGLSGHRLHDLRHTYAVNALKQGYKPQVVAHQLGHKDATMVTKVYGRFVPSESDYVVTNVATTPSRKARGKRA